MVKALRRTLLLLLRHSLRFPRVTLSLFYSLALIGFLASGKVEQLIDLNDLFDDDFSTYHELQLISDSFPDKNVTYVIISTDKSGTPPSKKAFCALSRWTLDVSFQVQDVLQVVSTFGARYGTNDGPIMAMEKVLKLDCGDLENPEMESIKAGLEGMKNTPWRAILSSKNSDDIVISFHLDTTEVGNNPFRKEQRHYFRTQAIDELRASLESEVLSKFPELNAYWSGIGTFKYHLKNSYLLAGITNNLGIIVILFFFKWVFGTWKSGFIFLISYLVALFPVLGGMAATLVPLDTLTTALPIMLMIAGLEDFIYISFVRRSSGANWRKPFRRILFPGFWTSVTTLIGFGSLATSDLAIIQRFGLWAAIAVMVEFATCYYFIPCFLKVHPRFRNWVAMKENARVNQFTQKINKMNLPKSFAVASIALFLLIPFGLHRLTITERPEDSFKSDHEAHQVIKKVKETRGWQTEISLVFYDWENKEKNLKVLDFVSKHPLVGAIENPYEVEDYLIQNMPKDQGLLLLDMWRTTPLSQRLRMEDGTHARALVYIRETEMNAVQALQADVAKLCEGDCYLGGTTVSYGEFGDKVLKTLIGSLGWSDFFVVTVLIFLCIAQKIREPIRIISVILASLWGPLFIFLIFIIFQVPIFYVTSIFAAVLVGLAGDSAVQFIFAKKDGDAFKGAEELGPASIYLTIGMILVSAVFFVSPFAPVNKLGLLIICGLIASLFGELWIMKALLSRGRKP